MAARKSRSSITTSEELKLQFDQMKNGMSSNEFLALLLQSFNGNPDNTVSEFTTEEQEIISKASQLQSYGELLKEGLLTAARKAITVAEKLDNPDLDLNKSTLKGVAKIRIIKAIEAIAYHNDSATEQDEKWLISKGTIFKACGANRVTIAKLVENDLEVMAMIESHNAKHGLTEMSNHKGKGVKFNVSI